MRARHGVVRAALCGLKARFNPPSAAAVMAAVVATQ